MRKSDKSGGNKMKTVTIDGTEVRLKKVEVVK